MAWGSVSGKVEVGELELDLESLSAATTPYSVRLPPGGCNVKPLSHLVAANEPELFWDQKPGGQHKHRRRRCQRKSCDT